MHPEADDPKSSRRWARRPNLMLESALVDVGGGTLVDAAILDASERGMQLSLVGEDLPAVTPGMEIAVWTTHWATPTTCEVRWWAWADAARAGVRIGLLARTALPPELWR